MAPIGLEINDAGIMAADLTSDRMLKVDGFGLESPGFALVQKKNLLVGEAAERRFCLSPRFVSHIFWDQLSTEPMDKPGFQDRTNAELAFAHLAEIWRHIKAYGKDTLIAVPPFYSQEQLGLILGMAQELSMPVRGLASLPVASAKEPVSEENLFHLDISLHRAIVTALRPGVRLVEEKVVFLPHQGLSHLTSEWMKAIAAEFVQKTRFDPFHNGGSEQEIYDRLPETLNRLCEKDAIDFDVRSGLHRYSVTLTKDLFLQKSSPLFSDIRRHIDTMRTQGGDGNRTMALFVTHRVARIPGWKTELAKMPDARIITLQPGAAAFGIGTLMGQFAAGASPNAVGLLTSRPWNPSRPKREALLKPDGQGEIVPTHLLYKNLAYPITDRPLLVGLEKGEVHVALEAGQEGISPKHFSLERRGGEVLLTNHSPHGTFVDENLVRNAASLKLGQTIRIGTPGETLQVIASVKPNET